jgi:hypothetical protein
MADIVMSRFCGTPPGYLTGGFNPLAEVYGLVDQKTQQAAQQTAERGAELFPASHGVAAQTPVIEPEAAEDEDLEEPQDLHLPRHVSRRQKRAMKRSTQRLLRQTAAAATAPALPSAESALPSALEQSECLDVQTPDLVPESPSDVLENDERGFTV